MHPYEKLWKKNEDAYAERLPARGTTFQKVAGGESPLTREAFEQASSHDLMRRAMSRPFNVPASLLTR